MELIELKANTRGKTGKGPARVLRREGLTPAIMYGPDTAPVMMSVPTRDFQQALKKSAAAQPLFNITMQNENASPHAVMIKELQTHPLSREFLHIDFYKIDMNRKIRVSVPVITTGKSIGVEEGGMLQLIRRELEVSCLPHLIPAAIEIDVTELVMGDSVHVEDIPLEEEVEILADVNFTVLTILSPTRPEEEEEEEEEGLEEGLEADGAEAATEDGSES